MRLMALRCALRRSMNMAVAITSHAVGTMIRDPPCKTVNPLGTIL
jgi:hypothetical protein